MRVSEQEFRFMVEGITSDLIQLLMDREQYTLPQAVETVYGSSIYLALHRVSRDTKTFRRLAASAIFCLSLPI